MVTVIPSLRRDAEREKNRKGYRTGSRNGKKTFETLLEEESTRQGDIQITTRGYTKDAKPANANYRTREYPTADS